MSNILTSLTTKYNSVFNYMLEFLCFVDRYSLCLAYPPYKKGIHKKHLDFSCVIRKYLVQFGLSPDEWCNQLRAHKNVMTGSFILWCMFEDTNWIYNDIDIVGAYKKEDPFLYWLLKTHSTTVEYDDIKIKPTQIELPLPCLLWKGNESEQIKWSPENILFAVDDINQYERYTSVYMHMVGEETMHKFHQKSVELQNRQYPHTLPIVSRTYEFDKCTIPINHIHYCNPDNSNPFHYISEYFDVDFCKVAFDGIRLYVYNWNDIHQKSSRVNWDHYLRIHTPYYQGPHPPFEDRVGYEFKKAREAWFLLRLLHRQERYQHRGFKVSIEGADKVDLTYQSRLYIFPVQPEYQQTLTLDIINTYENRYVL